jgi:phage anti-repressor protein
MNELIKIGKSGRTGNPVVNARDLHEFLEAKQDFSNWLKGRIKKYGFVENIDYARIFYDIDGKKLPVKEDGELKLGESQWVFRIEYALTLDCAKELAMVQSNDKGRQARLYFIEIEKQFRALKEVQKGVETKPVVLYTMSEVAEKLKLTDYYGGIGRNALYNILYHHKIVDEKNHPLPKYVKKGYFATKHRVTEEGLNWLNQMFCVEKTNDNTELQQQVAELKKDQKTLVEGVRCLVETMLYNKGSNRTEEQNRLAISHLQKFLETTEPMKALKQ